MPGQLVFGIIALKLIAITTVRGSPLSNGYLENADKNVLSEENFVPVEPIPETGLYTGIYYKLGLERFPSGWVTWTNKKHPSGGWHYMQIDSRSDHRQNYQKNGDWYNDIHWFFVPSKAEPGWYSLKNRQLSESVAMISRDENVGSGYHIVFTNADPDLADALWKPVAQGQNETGLYQLVIKSEPEGVITWTEALVTKDVPDSHFIQVDVNTDPGHRGNYLENGGWYVDSLFRFEQIDSDLMAELTQIELQLFPKLEEIRQLTKIDCDTVDSLIFTNVENKAVVKDIKQRMVNRGQLKLKLDQNIPTMKIMGSAGSISPSWYADSVEFQMAKQEVKSSEEIKLKTVETCGISTSVVVPGWSTTEVRICREYFDTEGTEVDIEAWVYLEVSEKSERPLVNKGKFNAVFGKLPVEEFAYKKLKNLLAPSRNGEEEIDVRWESLLVAGGNSGFVEEVGSVQILGKRETEVVLKVKGNIKGRFGYRGVVASN